MIGVGVGVNANKAAKPVHADNPVYTLGYTKNASNSAYATAYNVTSNNIGWTVYANISTNSGYYIGGKGTSNLTRTFTSTNYIAASIDRIVIHTGTLDAGSASVTAKASTNSDFSSAVKNFSSTALGASDDFEITYDEGTDANSYFQLTFTVNPNNKNNNKKVVVTSIDFYEHVASSETITGVSASLKQGNYYAGDTLSETNFNVTVSWSGEKADTHPLSGFSWTVNGTPNGALVQGDNSIIVTYQEVSSDPFNVVATIEHGTVQSDPLDVAEAIAAGNGLANNAETNKEYYIHGTVSEISYNSLAGNSHQATFWLLNGETIRGFQAYNIGAEEGCTNYDDLLVGAEVLIKGKIKKYNSTIESGTGAKILSISYTPPVLTGISLNKTESTLEVGNTETLVASPIPNIATLGTVTWASSNSLVATVEDGVVTAVTAGSATITAFIDENGNGSLDNEEMNATCSYTITAAPAEKVVAIDSISVGDTVYLFASAVAQQFNDLGGTGTSTYGAGVSYTGAPDKNGIVFEVVDGSADDSYAFKIKSGTNADKFIAWNSGNYLVVADSVTDNSSWSVSFDSDKNAIIANVANSAREIWWNVSSPRFSCYTDKTNGSSYKYTQLGKVMTPTSYFGLATSIKTISGVESNGGTTVENVALRFGEIIPVSAWSNINANWTITDYGIMFARGSMLTARSKSSLEEVFRNDPSDVAIVHKQVFSNPNANGDNYVFTARLNLDEVDYDEVFYAAPFIVAGGEYYFLPEMNDSVRTLAEECYNNGGSSLSQTALATLKGNN